VTKYVEKLAVKKISTLQKLCLKYVIVTNAAQDEKKILHLTLKPKSDKINVDKNGSFFLVKCN